MVATPLLHPAFDPDQWVEPAGEPAPPTETEVLACLTTVVFDLRDEIREQTKLLARLVFILGGDETR